MEHLSAASGVLLAMVGMGGSRQTEVRPVQAEMVLVPAGEFEMGISEEEAQALAREYGVHPSLFTGWTPRRKVNLKAFLIDRYPVTNAQYEAFVKATGRRPPGYWAAGTYPEGQGEHPVVSVNADDALAYAAWAGKRLPTAEEWEKAARGTDGRLYPWGNEWDDEACAIDDGSAAGTGRNARPPTASTAAAGTGRNACPPAVSTAAVGSLPKGASPYGVMDMVGNVAQWTGSDAAPKDAERNWAWYVVKGAARVHTQRYNFLCAARNFSAHNSRWHDWLGFRCAMDAEGTEGAGAMNGAPTSGAMNRAPTLGRDESRPYMGGGAPKRPEMPGPDEGAVGRPIEMVCAGPGATIRVPWFPRGYFGLSFPEQIGAEGLPLGWGVQHSGFRPVNEGGVVGYDCTFEGKAELRARLKGGVDYVDFTLTLRNLTDRAFTNVHSNTCFNCWQSPYFDDPERVRSFVWTDEGPTCFLRMPHGGGGEPLHNGWTVAKPGEPAPVGGDRVHYPIIALRSRDGKWMVAQTYDQGVTVASNAHYACLHSRPTWPDIPPGETVSRTGRLYFIRGGVEELLARWKADVGE